MSTTYCWYYYYSYYYSQFLREMSTGSIALSKHDDAVSSVWLQVAIGYARQVCTPDLFPRSAQVLRCLPSSRLFLSASILPQNSATVSPYHHTCFVTLSMLSCSLVSFRGVVVRGLLLAIALVLHCRILLVIKME